MKNIQKALIFMLALSILLTFSACGAKKSTPQEESAQKEQIIKEAADAVKADMGTEPEQPEAEEPDTENTATGGAETEAGLTVTETTQPDTDSTPKTAETPVPQGTVLKWEEFYALSSEAKDAYLKSFESYDDFLDWMEAAQAQFRKDYPDIELGAGGAIDLSLFK